MRRLFLIRHAKAEPSVGRDDYERRLTDRGRADARRVAAALAARKMLPDLLVHSGAARAKETAEIFAAEWPRRVELMEETGLYDAPARRPRGPQPRTWRARDRVDRLGRRAGDAPPRRQISHRRHRGARFFCPSMARRRAQVRDAGALPDAGRARGGRGLSVGHNFPTPDVPGFGAGGRDEGAGRLQVRRRGDYAGG